MEGRMGECCAGPPPFCEVLIHTKRGNRAIRRTRPEALFPPSKASGQFSAGYPSKEAAWPQPANFAEPIPRTTVNKGERTKGQGGNRPPCMGQFGRTKKGSGPFGRAPAPIPVAISAPSLP